MRNLLIRLKPLLTTKSSTNRKNHKKRFKQLSFEEEKESNELSSIQYMRRLKRACFLKPDFVSLLGTGINFQSFEKVIIMKHFKLLFNLLIFINSEITAHTNKH